MAKITFAQDKYKLLTALNLLVGGGLLTVAILATKYSMDEMDEETHFERAPFFVGGYIVGLFQLLSALFAVCLLCGGHDNTRCCLIGHIAVGMFTFMGCFIGFIFAGVFGIGNAGSIHESSPEVKDRNRKMAFAIIGGCACAILVNIFTLYLACHGGIKGQSSLTNANTVPVNTVTNTSSSYINTEFNLLREQNRLLQEQLNLQRQQQEQQPQPFGVFGQSPPPPSYDAVMNNKNINP